MRQIVNRTIAGLMLCCAASAAMAQTPTPGAPPPDAPIAEDRSDLRASSLLGADVRNGENESIGSVTDVLLAGGSVKAVIVSVGGFLGLGSRSVALAPADLQMNRKSEKTVQITTALTRDKLRQHPEFNFIEDWDKQSVASQPIEAKPDPRPGANAAQSVTGEPVRVTPTAPSNNDSAAPREAGQPSSEQPPLSGANSFTEGQAKARVAAEGFSDIGTLTKDEEGIWRGRAMRDGVSRDVAVDFKGNVVAK